MTAPGSEEPPDLSAELHRLDTFVRAYQSMSGDAERRRALNYLRDRFPEPPTMRGDATHPYP